MKKRIFPFVFLLSFFISNCSSNSFLTPASLSSIAVEEPWIRAVPEGSKSTAAYFTLINNGNMDDMLIGVESKTAKKSMLHQTVSKKGISSMQHRKTVHLSPGEKVVFKPGGMHVMLMGIHSVPKEGEKIPLTLKFKKAGKVFLMLDVKK